MSKQVEQVEIKKFIMNKKNINAAVPNSITVVNSKEGYKNYFKLGGTVAKMTPDTTRRYLKFKKAKQSV